MLISADYIFPISSEPIKNGVIEIDENGKVLDLFDPENDIIEWNNVTKHEGIICPGFVNTHCHLELSYLKNQITEKTSLPGFIKEIIAKRNSFSEEERLESIAIAEQELWNNGVVAVGDISNGDSTFKFKQKSKIQFHTFVEVFGSSPSIAKEAFNTSEKLYDSYFNDKASITPHATYSVSNELTQLIHNHCINNNSIVSIHNQETESENTFYQKGEGTLFEFLQINDKTDFVPTKQNALPSFLGKYNDLNNNILLIHNTFTNKEDIKWANQFSNNIYWCFCPNANLYIENRLPNFELFINENCTIGTDSLASNWSLSILGELKVIAENSPTIPLKTLLKWATLNGAKALNFENTIGSFEVGKTPGLNLIKNLKHLSLTNESTIEKLI